MKQSVSLEDFDISKLDAVEAMQYQHLIKESSKKEVLQILINNVEGDFSQLSKRLAAIAKKIELYETE